MVPQQIVDDIWRASDPNNPVLTPTFKNGAPPTSGLVHLWWWPWIIANVIDRFSLRDFEVKPSVESFRSTAVTGTVSFFFYVILGSRYR